jgi:serine/threonine protein kinase
VESDLEELPPGTLLGAYRIVGHAPGSTLAKTYKAQHVASGVPCLVKVLPALFAKNSENKKRFERECQILLRLRHPNLIVGHEEGEHRGQKYLIMEHVPGPDLASLVRQRGPLSVEQAVNYLLQAARGLASLHAHGVVHRNIKPHILLLDAHRNLRITNLFLARIADSSTFKQEPLTRAGAQMGSADYMAPEQAMDPRQADARSDIYALGCTLFHLLTGRPPYAHHQGAAKALAHEQSPVPSVQEARSETPEFVARTFARMIAKDPAARFQFATELISALTGSEQVVLR